MTEPTRTYTRPAIHIRRNVKNDVIWMCRIATYATDAAKIVEAEVIAHSPGNHVVCARSVTAYAHGTYDLMVRVIKTETATENVYTTGLFAHHWIIRGSPVRRRTFISNASIDRIAVLQAVEATAGLHRGVQIRRR